MRLRVVHRFAEHRDVLTVATRRSASHEHSSRAQSCTCVALCTCRPLYSHLNDRLQGNTLHQEQSLTCCASSRCLRLSAAASPHQQTQSSADATSKCDGCGAFAHMDARATLDLVLAAVLRESMQRELHDSVARRVDEMTVRWCRRLTPAWWARSSVSSAWRKAGMRLGRTSTISPLRLTGARLRRRPLQRTRPRPPPSP